MATQTQPVLLRRDTVGGRPPAKAEFTLNTFVVNSADSILYFLDVAGNVQGCPILPGLTSAELTLPSAATADLATVISPMVAISGTTAITSFGTGRSLRKTIRFLDVLRLTHNAASLFIPGLASIITAAGDIADVSSDANGNWRVRSYSRADGSSFTIPADIARGNADQALTASQRRQTKTNLRVRSSGVSGLNAATTLDATSAGLSFYTLTGGFTVTVPAANTIANGETLEFSNLSTGILTLAVPANTGALYFARNNSANTLQIYPGCSCLIASDGNTYIVGNLAPLRDAVASTDYAQSLTVQQRRMLRSNTQADGAFATTFNGAFTVNPGQYGGTFFNVTPSQVTVNLPPISTSAPGDFVRFTNNNAPGLVVQVDQGADQGGAPAIVSSTGTSAKSFFMSPASSAVFRSNGSNWYIEGLAPTNNTVRSGGGTGMLANQVLVGWSGSAILAQVDNSPMGEIWMSNNNASGALAGDSWYQRLPSGMLLMGGTVVQTLDANGQSVIAYPIAAINNPTPLAGQGDATIGTIANYVQGNATDRFTVRFGGGANTTIRINWFAFGRWK